MSDSKKKYHYNSKNIVVLFLLLFIILFLGIIAGRKVICEKGTQTRIGNIQQLSAMQPDAPQDSLISTLISLINPQPLHPKFILIRNNEDVIQITYSNAIDIIQFINSKVIATGSYNTCSNTLYINNQNDIEVYKNQPANY